MKTFSVLLTALLCLLPTDLSAQQVITRPQQAITIVRGSSALVQIEGTLERVSIADPAIADAIVIPPREVMVNAVSIGMTSLFVWREGQPVRSYSVEVVPDMSALERRIEAVAEGIEVSTIGGDMVVLSGTVQTPAAIRRAVEIAEATGATVVNDLSLPEAQQILLHVRFAEVERSAIRELGTDLFVQNPQNVAGVANADTSLVETLSEGIVRLLLVGEDYRLESVIRALKQRGEFRSLAEPNLLAVEGQEATFLAGGEFPFPVVQGGNLNAVTIVWKEFGVRLAFTPRVTDDGAIRLRVAPEVSSLDFSNGLAVGGFEIPSLLTRRVDTEVELRPGQHLAIAGLIDNSLLESSSRIPILGDIPILGLLFRSKNMRQQRSELLVLVTPHLVSPSDTPLAIPSGEPGSWDWVKGLRDAAPDSAGDR
jgi:pilus assembly protein CpaC